MLAWVCA